MQPPVFHLVVRTSETEWSHNVGMGWFRHITVGATKLFISAVRMVKSRNVIGVILLFLQKLPSIQKV